MEFLESSFDIIEPVEGEEDDAPDVFTGGEDMANNTDVGANEKFANQIRVLVGFGGHLALQLVEFLEQIGRQMDTGLLLHLRVR